MIAPTTRYYSVRAGTMGAWARIWITDDGCFTTISDHGNYGYWWGSPGGEFRKFLCTAGVDYVENKLACDLPKEVDHDKTVANIRKKLWDMMSEGDIDKPEYDDELDALDGLDFSSPADCGVWSERQTKIDLSEASDIIVSERPMQVRMFMKVLWPLFIEQLKKKLAFEADVEATELLLAQHCDI